MKSRAQIFGENLDRILKEKQIARKDFAKMLNVTVATVGTYINAKREPSLDKLFEIAKILNVSTSELIGDNKNVEEEKIFNSEFEYVLELLDLTDIFAIPKEGQVKLVIIKSGNKTETESEIRITDGEYEVYEVPQKALVALIKSLVMMMLSVANKKFEELIKKALEKSLEEQHQ